MKTIEICGIPYEVKLVDTGFSECGQQGECDFNTCTIKINKDLSQAQKNDTLMHEVVHAMCYQLGHYDITNNETFVQGMGNALFQLLSKNERILF